MCVCIRVNGSLRGNRGCVYVCVCVCVCVCVNGSLRGNRAKTECGYWESRKGSVRRIHVSDIPAEERWANFKSQGEWKKFYSRRLNCPSSQRGLPGQSSVDRLSPEQLRTWKGQQVFRAFFSQIEPHLPPHSPLLSSLSPYLERNWGYWWGTGWDCRQGLQLDRL